MTADARPPDVRDIVVEEILPHSVKVVWRTLTESNLIAGWAMPNDFEPVAGHRFTFHTQPMGDWDGVVHCEVLEIVPHERLVYSWVGGAKTNDRYGSRLDSTVTWTLAEVEGGCRLKLVHSGFRSPGNDFAFNVMGSGWAKVMRGIDRVAAGLDRG